VETEQKYKSSKDTQSSVHKILFLQILEKENSFKKCEIIKPDWQYSKHRKPKRLKKKERKNKMYTVQSVNMSYEFVACDMYGAQCSVSEQKYLSKTTKMYSSLKIL